MCIRERFREWTPNTGSSYVGAWFAIFALAILYEGLSAAYNRADALWWARYCSASSDIESGCGAPKAARLAAMTSLQLIAMDIARGLSRVVLGGLAYLLMMSVMTFNLGIFFAAIAGFGVGSALFGRRSSPPPTAGKTLP